VTRPFRVGELEVTPLSDGTAKMPPQYFVNADFSAHQDLLGPDGMIDVPLGCFLVRSGDRTVLIDAGIGPYDNPIFQGGQLPDALAAAGVARGAIDTVVCTHLHVDHVGWLAHEGAPFFPNATVRFGSGDWDQFVANAAEGDLTRTVMETLAAADRLQAIDADGEEVAPGITARYAPGHTLGHYCLVLSSGDERALLLGDAVTCPVQLEEPDWQAISDVDPALAVRTREALWRELEGTDARAVAAHFPGLEFGRVLPGQGKRYFQV
jgi:glyoxylase-like metal-dependent hydrolase (beta-lactamase superfamily II)